MIFAGPKGFTESDSLQFVMSHKSSVIDSPEKILANEFSDEKP